MRVLVVLALLAIVATPVFAHTGPVIGTPGNYQLIDNEIEVDLNLLATHDEVANNYATPVYKGWYSVNVTNKSTKAWTGMLIQAQGTGVYLVQGNNLQDEWGITGNSVICTQTAATPTYAGPGGTVNYDYGATGNLFGQVFFQFASPIAAGQKVGFKIYTDNTAFDNTSFGVLFTPTAVPEPSALAGMLGGLVGLAGFAIRRRK